MVFLNVHHKFVEFFKG